MDIHDILKHGDDFVALGQGNALLKRLNSTFNEYGIMIDNSTPILSMSLEGTTIRYDVECAENKFSFLVDVDHFSNREWGHVKDLAGVELETQEEFNLWLKRLLDTYVPGRWTSMEEMPTQSVNLWDICPEKISNTEAKILLVINDFNKRNVDVKEIIDKGMDISNDYINYKGYNDPCTKNAYKFFCEEFVLGKEQFLVGEELRCAEFMNSVAASDSLEKWESQMKAFINSWKETRDKDVVKEHEELNK